jgi:hypothetical protein
LIQRAAGKSFQTGFFNFDFVTVRSVRLTFCVGSTLAATILSASSVVQRYEVQAAVSAHARPSDRVMAPERIAFAGPCDAQC